MPFLVALLVAAALVPLVAPIATRVGLVDQPGDDGLKIHTESKPLSGGIAIVSATFIAVALVGHAFDPWSVAAIVVLLGVGVIDDAIGLPPLVRLAAQFGAGLLLAAGGLTFESLQVAGPVAVVVAVPSLANAVNIADGQDGLAAGLSLIAAVGIVAIGVPVDAALVLGLAFLGTMTAFLVWNRPPASIFLGDGGAYAIGGILVVLAAGASGSWPAFLGTLVCLALFIVELVSTVFRRVAGSASLTRGDRDHVYDLLASRLGSRARATVGMWGVGAIAALFGWIASRSPTPIAAGIASCGAVLGYLAVQALRRNPGGHLRRSG